VQDALHLAAEVGVAWGVDDVDAGVFPDQRGDLRQDGDAALALDVVGSIMRSSVRWLSRNAPDCFRRTSIKVVLPWSTCAMMAMLRSFMSWAPKDIAGPNWSPQRVWI
jgi:hypothetical protein